MYVRRDIPIFGSFGIARKVYNSPSIDAELLCYFDISFLLVYRRIHQMLQGG